MNLEEFISQAIIQITKGITTAQNVLADEWVRINPKPAGNFAIKEPMIYVAENGAAVFPLSFDVAVTAEEKQGDVAAGIKVLGIEAKIKDGSTEARSTVSRVSFTIPVAYPLKRVS